MLGKSHAKYHCLPQQFRFMVGTCSLYKLPVILHAAHILVTYSGLKVTSMSSFIFIVLIVGVCHTLQFCCHAHVVDDDYRVYNTCIGEYTGLESYILSNQIVLTRIKEAFFKTGKAPSNFVKIRYDFYITNDTKERDNINCTPHQDVYFWSSSPLYLLGPKALRYSTIFAIDVSEEIVTISLPCLCKNVHGPLLSRLTYLVSNKLWTNYCMLFVTIGEGVCSP